MNRTEKQELIDDLHAGVRHSRRTRSWSTTTGSSVPAVTEFRRKVRRAGSTLPRGEEHPGPAGGQGHAARAAGADSSTAPRRGLHGNDPVALAKVLTTSPRTTRSWWSRAGWSTGTPDARRRGRQGALRPCPACPSCAPSCSCLHAVAGHAAGARCSTRRPQQLARVLTGAAGEAKGRGRARLERASLRQLSFVTDREEERTEHG